MRKLGKCAQLPSLADAAIKAYFCDIDSDSMKLLLPFLLLLAAALTSACGGEDKKETNTAEADTAFNRFSRDFISGLWATYPGWATSVGYHERDEVLTVPDEAQREKEAAFLKQMGDALKKQDPAALSPLNQMDYSLIGNFIQSSEWNLNTFKSWTWDASSYNVADAFAALVNENYAPLAERMEKAVKKLSAVPAYYEAAIRNLDKPSRPHVELAIQQNKGTIDYLKTAMADSVKKAGLSAEVIASFEKSLAAAETAIQSYIAHLESLLKGGDEGFRNFRIGQQAFEAKFSYDIQSGYTAEQIYEKALSRKAEVQQKMIGLCKDLYPKYFKNAPAKESYTLADVKSLIDIISLQHSKRENFVEDVKKQIPELTRFVNEKNLLHLDPARPLVVRETPEYMRGFAGASINAPGPYDKTGNTYYNVTPLDAYTAEQAESWLREYNDYLLQVLNIHEAIPGHYAQLVYSNNSPSLIKSILGNGAMVEGWAVYTERMMLEEGYGNQAPELWLMYYKWHLRSIINTILDYSIHVKGMTQEEAMKLMIDEGFQQQAEAAGKWRRATLSQVQLCSYFTGFTEIYELREEMKKQQGASFDLRKFHEQILSYGSSPVKLISKSMKAGQ